MRLNVLDSRFLIVKCFLVLFVVVFMWFGVVGSLWGGCVDIFILAIGVLVGVMMILAIEVLCCSWIVIGVFVVMVYVVVMS